MKIMLWKQNLCENYFMCLYNRFVTIRMLSVLLWNFALKVSSNLFFFPWIFQKSIAHLLLKWGSLKCKLLPCTCWTCCKKEFWRLQFFCFLLNKRVEIAKVFPNDGSRVSCFIQCWVFLLWFFILCKTMQNVNAVWLVCLISFRFVVSLSWID